MPATTIALLPFEDLSGDPAQDVIARGLSLDLAVELSRFATLDVIPPSSAPQVVTMAGSGRASPPMFTLTDGVRPTGGPRPDLGQPRRSTCPVVFPQQFL